jgi:hypothetical protein
MSWHFSQALVAAFLEASSLGGERSAPSNSIPSAPDDSCSAKMKDTWHRSLFGTMYAPSTDGHGEELLTWFQEASRVRTLAQPEKAQELKEPKADFGERWHESLARWDRDTCSWRTPQTLFSGDLAAFSGIWPRWGLMRTGECWGRITPGHLTGGTEFGSWPTPRSTDGDRGGRGDLIQAVRGNKNNHFKLWPTPCASDADKWSNQSEAERIQKGQAVRLNTAVSPGGGMGGQLNPNWIEWLMGWPIGWTASAPLATGKFQEWLLSHGINSLED